MAAPHGAMAWFEMYSGDFAQTQRFYEQAFGWKFSTDMGPEYLMFDDSTGNVGGGFHPGMKPSDGSPMLYVFVDSIEKSLPQIAELGGTQVQGKTEIPTVGWWASVKDPQGNVIGVYETLSK